MEESLENHLFYDFNYRITLKVIQRRVFMTSVKKNGEPFIHVYPRVHHLTFQLFLKFNVLLRDSSF